MSDLNQIHTALLRLFNDEGQRIVFWNDPDREFQIILSSLELEGVTTLRLDEVGALEAKIRMERDEPTGKFLLYAPTEEPDPPDDWLLDIRLFSGSFRADRASLLLRELGLLTPSLRDHLLRYRKFFDAKDRLQKIKNLVAPDDAAADLDRKMIAVVARADQPELFNLMRTIFHAWIETENEIDLDNPPSVWGQIEKFDLDVPFWQMVKATFGYEEDDPTLKNLLLRLVLTDYAHHLKGDVPQSIRGLLLPRTGWSNAVVSLAQWRDSSSKGATLNEKRDVYEALLGNLGVKGIEVPSTIVKKFEKLLVGGIWCIVTLEYFFEEDQKGSPFLLRDLKPIQMPNMDLEELFQGRRAFTEQQWIDVLLRSTGMEPTNFTERVKWHLIARMIPLVENNYNLAELGPRGTGKSHIYKEISPNSILVSGGQTTVANLFYNMARRQVGLVGVWDVVAFDEVAGISFKDKDGVQIMKDYMASGSFARGRDAINAYASMVFVGNINQPVDTLVKTSHLFAPFPETMIDSAFFDRFHAYVPGWEVPKMRPEFFTNQYGLIVDYLAEWLREMRKRNFGDAINKYFKLGRDLNQRDTIAVKHTVSGLLKLLYPNEEYDKEAVRRCLEYALEVRRRVKEQLKKIGGMEFFDVHFSYIDMETMEEKFISVPEQGGGSLIPDGPLNPGVMHTVATGGTGSHLGLYRLETQVTSGNGTLKTSGLGSNSAAKEAIKVGFDYFKANAHRVSASIKPGDHDFHLHVVELQNTGPTTAMTLAAFVALCSGVFGKPIQPQMVILGSMSLGGNIVPVENLAESLQVAFDAGAKRLLLPMASVKDIPTIPGELFAKFQTGFYADPVDAVFKALGVQ